MGAGAAALLAVIRRGWMTVACCALLGALASAVVNTFLPVQYSAVAKILVAAPEWNDTTNLADPNISGKVRAYGDTFTQQRMATYKQLAETALVLGSASRELGNELSGAELGRKIDVRIVPDTVVMEVRATDSSPSQAARIADVAARQVISTIKQVERPPATLISPIQPVLTEPAVVPSRPSSPNNLVNILGGLAVGCLVGVTLRALREARRSAAAAGEGSHRAPRNVLGVLTPLPGEAATIDTSGQLLRWEVASALAPLNIVRLLVCAPRSSPASIESAYRIASTFGQGGRRAVVVSADWSGDDPAADAEPGLGDVLRGAVSVTEVVTRDDVHAVDWVPAGRRPNQPTDAGSAARFRRVMAELSRRYDCVVVAGPAVLEDVAAIEFAGHVGAAALVVPMPQTRDEELDESERLLGVASGRYLGRIYYGEVPAGTAAIVTGHRSRAAREQRPTTHSGGSNGVAHEVVHRSAPPVADHVVVPRDSGGRGERVSRHRRPVVHRHH